MIVDSQQSNVQADRLFDGIAHNYEGPAKVLSFFQYSRWRHFLISRLRLAPQTLVLDVCTGTGLVAAEIARRTECSVVGVDLSQRMIEQGRRILKDSGAASSVNLVRGRAESLPFDDQSFDAVVFTFLLRYVDHPQTTLTELARVLRPGGQMASLEFFVPRSPVPHAMWFLHTRLVLPSATRLLSPGWREVGSFLGPSISAFYQEHTLSDLSWMWTRAGLGNVQTKVLSLGGAVVTWGQKGDDSEN